MTADPTTEPAPEITEGVVVVPADPPVVEVIPVQVAMHRAMCSILGVGKNDRNDQQKFNFRGIDAVLNKVGPAFRAYGVIPLPKVLEHHAEIIHVGKWDTKMRQVTMMVEYAFVGPKGDRLSVEVPGEAMDAGDKAYSKAMSVAYRTALIQALALPTDERDPDADAYERSPAPVDDGGRTHGRGAEPERQAEAEAETAADRARRAQQMLDQVLAAGTREAAVNLWKLAKRSAYAEIDVSGLLDDHARQALGVEPGEALTITKAAARAGAFVKENDRAIRPAAEPEGQGAADEQAAADDDAAAEQ